VEWWASNEATIYSGIVKGNTGGEGARMARVLESKREEGGEIMNRNHIMSMLAGDTTANPSELWEIEEVREAVKQWEEGIMEYENVLAVANAFI
jgi:hypothetical protein